MKTNIKYEKHKSLQRYVILLLTCLMLVGSYWCYDIPSSCKTQIDDYMGDDENFEHYFSLLYSLYSFPNIILPFFGGFFIDTFGVRKCMLIFSTILVIGQVIFSFGLSVKSWIIMWTGRFVFGIGAESFTIANSTLIAIWFKGSELALAFTINTSISRLSNYYSNYYYLLQIIFIHSFIDFFI
jgi:MFS family permease